MLRQATACYLAVVRDCAGRVAESGPAGDLVAALEDGRGTPASIARGVAVLLGLATTPALETQPAALEAVRGPVRG